MRFLIPCIGNKKKEDDISIYLEVRKCGPWIDLDLGDVKPLLVQNHLYKTYANSASELGEETNLHVNDQYYSKYETSSRLKLKAPRSIPICTQPNSPYHINPSNLMVANIHDRNERNSFTRTDTTGYISSDTWSYSQPVCEHNLK
uniref:Uncharacterized protein n=1 Tax=Acrobeloides nanus TaxID=290746 RepID=A0A914E5B5_9BILA